MYNDLELMVFSLIFSDTTEDRFPKFKLSHNFLFYLFSQSTNDNKNIFNLTFDCFKEYLESIFEKFILEHPRLKREKYEREVIEYFIRDYTKFKSLKKIAKEQLILCKNNNINCIGFFSDNYPQKLTSLDNPPFILFYLGNFPEEKELEKSLAVIGTRNPDEKYGPEVAKRVGKVLSDLDWWNISGLALGCDTYGHMGAIKKTGAILGQGLLTSIYPKENINLAEEILNSNGFLLSELPPLVKPNTDYFLLRNRLQMALTSGIFLVEASSSGGSIKTTKLAMKHNKKILVWNPENILELNSKEEISGNKYLLNLKNKNIIGIFNSKELFYFLNSK